MAYLGWLIAVLWLALLLGVPSIRRAYGNGWHCVVRHPILWKLPAGFAAAYGLFHLIAIVLLEWRLGHGFSLDWQWKSLDASDWWALSAANALPAGEQLAALFSGLVSTFPIAALGALLFLVNAYGLTGELRRIFTRRWGWWGWLGLLVLVLCALAALLKPACILALPELSTRIAWNMLLPALTALNALAFVFEYLLGTVLQVYLLLTAYAWIRGLQFEREKLLPFAVRRMGFVFKWSLIMILATLVLEHAPLLIEAMLTGQISWMTESLIRPLLVGAMLAFGSVQIRLALHNDSLREALSANLKFLRRNGWSYAAFLFVGIALLLSLQTLLEGFRQSSDSTLPAQSLTVGGQAMIGAASGWVLAAWVCFYKSRADGTKEPAF